jgi:hypothetical protein
MYPPRLGPFGRGTWSRSMETTSARAMFAASRPFVTTAEQRFGYKR